MNPLSALFVRASLIYLAIAVIVGVTFTLWPQLIWSHRAMHAHIALLGWVSMFIFGVAYHVVPRISVRTLYSERLGQWHFYFANIGIIGLAVAFAIIPHQGWGVVRPLVLSSALSFAMGAFFFVFNIWKSMGPEPGKPVIQFANIGKKDK